MLVLTPGVYCRCACVGGSSALELQSADVPPEVSAHREMDLEMEKKGRGGGGMEKANEKKRKLDVEKNKNGKTVKREGGGRGNAQEEGKEGGKALCVVETLPP